jgi:hypothetical protein
LAKELARHSDVRLTAGIYSHVNLAEKAEAVNGMTFDQEPKANQGSSAIGSAPTAIDDIRRPLLTVDPKLNSKKERPKKRGKAYKRRLLAQKKNR